MEKRKNKLTVNNRDVQSIPSIWTAIRKLQKGGVVEDKYKVYTALLSQSGTDAPTAKILENTLGAVPTFQYFSEGTYQLVCPDKITEFKTALFGMIDGGSKISLMKTASNDSNVAILTHDPLGVLSDSLLDNSTIEIRVYPIEPADLLLFTASLPTVFENMCSSITENTPYYYYGAEPFPIVGDIIFTDPSGTILAATGFYSFVPLYIYVEDGVVIGAGDCGR